MISVFKSSFNYLTFLYSILFIDIWFIILNSSKLQNLLIFIWLFSFVLYLYLFEKANFHLQNHKKLILKSIRNNEFTQVEYIEKLKEAENAYLYLEKFIAYLALVFICYLYIY